MAKYDGGLAFPFETSKAPAANQQVHMGMSLRDYFAASALQGWLASCTNVDYEKAIDAASQDNLAAMAYRYADAMLAERRK